jgi:cellulose synthase/poly-beta-1,6-N-acetylglucosamine synthase-like glycosyltransferase
MTSAAENGSDCGARAEAQDAETADARLAWSIDGLRSATPEFSAYRTLTRRQKVTALVALVLIVVCLVLEPRPTGVALSAVVIAIYASTIGMRLLLILYSLQAGGRIAISDQEARAVPDEQLPRYTVMVPAYREPQIVGQLLDALDRLDYPSERLEVLLVLEADDQETIDASRAALDEGRPHVRVVPVPSAQPRTKPKALNYALLESTGDLVTIYDAEDEPEPLQLRKAAVALSRGDERLACLQAQLDYSNPDQNSITRWFTLEYTTWFTQFLPGLVHTGAPIPLGGTSNHFHKDVLLEVGGWDPYNVTEDADLGLRLKRLGYEVGVLQSVTLEEANSDFINWVKQRSRWYKGYLQTWLLHLRHPVESYRIMGRRGFAVFNLFVGGTPLLALLNPLFWMMTAIWFVLQPAFINQLFPGPVFFAALACWIIGNFLILYSFIITAQAETRVSLIKAALLMPFYFVMMSLAAYKALVQLVFTPSYWEKTTHGLNLSSEPVGSSG